MQRRAAAVYVAFFVIVGAVSFSLIATASAPTLSQQVENPEYELAKGESFTVGGTEYTVKGITAEMTGGGHGSAASLSRSGTLSYQNGTNTSEISVDDHANVTLGSTTYFAYFPDNSTMVLTQDFGAYPAYQQESAEYKDHTDGLWGVTILSGLVSAFLAGLAYMPSRY